MAISKSGDAAVDDQSRNLKYSGKYLLQICRFEKYYHNLTFKS